MEKFLEICKERLYSQCNIHGNGQCIIWTGSCKKGYGQFRYRDPRDSELAGHRTRSVHRIALMLDIGNLDVPPAQQASHLCNNKLCVNIHHLVFEDNFTNNNRKTCFFNQKCTGHGDGKGGQRPACLVELSDRP